MVDIQTILTYLTLISVPIGVFYHIMTLNNTRKNQKLQLETRQATLFMTIYEIHRSTEFRNHWRTMMDQKWTDFDDYWNKYGEENNSEEWTSWQSVAAYFHGIGILLKRD